MSNIGKRIKLLKSSAWWEEGEKTVVLEEDDKHVYFESSNMKYCAMAKSLEGTDFEYLPMTENQEYYTRKKEEILETKKKYRFELKETVIRLLGGKCVRCGFNKVEALDVKGGGGRGQKGYTAYYNRVLSVLHLAPGQTEYKVLCANCQRLYDE